MYSLTMARAHPYRFCFGRRFDQRGRSSPAPLALCARWDSGHGLSPWNHTPHCQLITVPVRLTNELRSFSSLLRRPVSRDGTLSTVFCCLHAWLRALYTRPLWHPALLELPATLMYSLLVAAGDPVRIRLLDFLTGLRACMLQSCPHMR